MNNQQNPLDLLSHPAVRRNIRRTAVQLARRRDFAFDDLEDIEGALRVLIAARLVHFDPARSPIGAFARRCAQNAAASLVRDRHRDRRRAAFHTWSFGALPPDDHGRERCAEGITENDAARRRGSDVRDSVDHLITRLAIDQIVAELDPELVIVVRLLREEPRSVAAKRLGISPRRLRALISELRDRFEAGGFGA